MVPVVEHMCCLLEFLSSPLRAASWMCIFYSSWLSIPTYFTLGFQGKEQLENHVRFRMQLVWTSDWVCNIFKIIYIVRFSYKMGNLPCNLNMLVRLKERKKSVSVHMCLCVCVCLYVYNLAAYLVQCILPFLCWQLNVMILLFFFLFLEIRAILESGKKIILISYLWTHIYSLPMYSSCNKNIFHYDIITYVHYVKFLFSHWSPLLPFSGNMDQRWVSAGMTVHLYVKFSEKTLHQHQCTYKLG